MLLFLNVVLKKKNRRNNDNTSESVDYVGACRMPTMIPVQEFNNAQDNEGDREGVWEGFDYMQRKPERQCTLQRIM
jgi:hypothetical protein